MDGRRHIKLISRRQLLLSADQIGRSKRRVLLHGIACDRRPAVRPEYVETQVTATDRVAINYWFAKFRYCFDEFWTGNFSSRHVERCKHFKFILVENSKSSEILTSDINKK